MPTTTPEAVAGGGSARSIRVLVVEDSPAARALVVATLVDEGCEVVEAADGERALVAAAGFHPEVVVLDVGLPGMDGLHLLGLLRQEHNPGVILLTGRASESERVQGLDLGADDYVVKPFLPSELGARVRAVWRRREAGRSGGWLRYPGLEIDIDGRQVIVGGEPLTLRRREFDLLYRLASAPGRVFSRRDLLRDVWGAESESTERTVTEHVRRLRGHIEPDPARPAWIQSRRGSGYRFDPQGGTRSGLADGAAGTVGEGPDE